MPIVNSLHSKVLEDYKKENADKSHGDINILISNITFDILKDSPYLVADVEQGKVDKEVLEMAIIKNIDDHKYHHGLSREVIIKKVFDYMFGYGVLQDFINDEDISDIDGTRYNAFVIKKFGKTIPVDINFGNEKIFETYCKLITVRNGGKLNENDSHCRVSDEKYRLRINTSISPRNLSGPSISIRKHRLKSYTFADLVNLGMISQEIADYLSRVAKSNMSILFTGKGGSGKTTLMRVVINAFNPLERVLVMESDSELYPDSPYVTIQRVKKANEGGLPITLQDLIKDGLTMRVDTYVIGEIVGSEAYPFIQAGFTGHRILGSLHTWESGDAPTRLLTMAKAGGASESEKVLKELIGKSIDLVVYLENFRATEITEILGYDGEKDIFNTNRVFEFRSKYKTYDDIGRLIGEFVKVNEPKAEKFLRKGE